MLKIKLLLLFGSWLLLVGCGTSSYYVLSMSSEPSATYRPLRGSIGVERVEVPKYLFKRKIAVAHSASEVSFIDGASWAEEMDEGLTRRLIGFLQKKFHHPEVYAYPWDMENQPDIRIRVRISRFIAEGKRVFLDASVRMENLHSGKYRAILFSKHTVSGSSASEIVAAMNRLFGQLEEKVATEIKTLSRI